MDLYWNITGRELFLESCVFDSLEQAEEARGSATLLKLPAKSQLQIASVVDLAGDQSARSPFAEDPEVLFDFVKHKEGGVFHHADIAGENYSHRFSLLIKR